jgi:hypothetical protein
MEDAASAGFTICFAVGMGFAVVAAKSIMKRENER